MDRFKFFREVLTYIVFYYAFLLAVLAILIAFIKAIIAKDGKGKAFIRGIQSVLFIGGMVAVAISILIGLIYLISVVIR